MSIHHQIKSQWPYPKWMAHRGGGKLAPENTIKAFRVGYQYGLRGVEFDVKLSSDNLAVVIHDDDLKRVAHLERDVKEISLAELTQIDAAAEYPQYQPAYVPSFKEVAEFCVENNIGTNVEIKPCLGRETETAAIVAQEALKYWSEANIPPLFSSFSIEALEVVKKLYPNSLRGLLIEDWSLGDAEIIKLLTELDCVSLHAPNKFLTQARAETIMDAGFVVLAWTVNDIARAQELISWGVKTIITDLIDQIPELL